LPSRLPFCLFSDFTLGPIVNPRRDWIGGGLVSLLTFSPLPFPRAFERRLAFLYCGLSLFSPSPVFHPNPFYAGTYAIALLREGVCWANPRAAVISRTARLIWVLLFEAGALYAVFLGSACLGPSLLSPLRRPEGAVRPKNPCYTPCSFLFPFSWSQRVSDTPPPASS